MGDLWPYAVLFVGVTLYLIGRRAGRRSVPTLTPPEIRLSVNIHTPAAEATGGPTRIPKASPEDEWSDALAQRPRVAFGSSLSDDFWFDVGGEASYQGTLRKVAGDRLTSGETVVVPMLIVPEPTNAYDKSAIAVYAEGFGKIGYFSRSDAEDWLEVSEALIARGAVGVCDGHLTGGWEKKKSIGVKLALKEDIDILEEMGA